MNLNRLLKVWQVEEIMNKPNLVLIPALFCNHRLFEQPIKILADKYNIMVADHTGWTTMSLLAEHILTKAPPHFALAGISMGGYLALEIMRQAPQRVKQLILMNTSARADTPEQTQKRLLAIKASEEGSYLEVISKMFPFLLHSSKQQDEILTSKLLLMAQEIGVDHFIKQLKAVMTRIDSRSFLSAIKCPTLVISGRQDQASPLDLMLEIHHKISHSKLLIIEECGHLSPLERPKAIISAWSNFLNNPENEAQQLL